MSGTCTINRSATSICMEHAGLLPDLGLDVLVMASDSHTGTAVHASK